MGVGHDTIAGAVHRLSDRRSKEHLTGGTHMSKRAREMSVGACWAERAKMRVGWARIKGEAMGICFPLFLFSFTFVNNNNNIYIKK